MVEADHGGGTSWIDIVGPIVVFGALVGFWYFMHHWRHAILMGWTAPARGIEVP